MAISDQGHILDIALIVIKPLHIYATSYLDVIHIYNFILFSIRHDHLINLKQKLIQKL